MRKGRKTCCFKHEREQCTQTIVRRFRDIQSPMTRRVRRRHDLFCTAIESFRDSVVLWGLCLVIVNWFGPTVQHVYQDVDDPGLQVM